MVGANFKGLITAHDQAGLLVFLVLEQTHVTGTTLLPFLGLAVKSEQLGAHLEGLVLKLLVGLNLNLLGQPNNGLEVDILALRDFILY